MQRLCTICRMIVTRFAARVGEEEDGPRHDFDEGLTSVCVDTREDTMNCE